MKEKRIKIRMYGVHLFYAGEHLLNSFEYYCGILDFSEWIKESAYLDFGVLLASAESIKSLEKMVRGRFYENIGEWIKEKMRQLIFASDKYISETRKNI